MIARFDEGAAFEDNDLACEADGRKSMRDQAAKQHYGKGRPSAAPSLFAPGSFPRFLSSTRFDADGSGQARPTRSTWFSLPGAGKLTAIRGTAMIIATLALSACDNRVNQNFEQSVEDRKTANAGDPYASLESSMPRLRRYVQTEKIQQQEFASGQSGQFRATYDNLLSKLDADKKVDRSRGLFKACRAAFANASRFQSQSGDDASAEVPAANKTLTELRTCRGAAKSLGERGALLARFASTGIVMIGAKTTGQGDTSRGTAVWREGEYLVSQDKPGFELNAKSFRGY